MDMKFNPFEDKLCRNVRNKLGQALVESIVNQSDGAFNAIKQTFQAHSKNKVIKEYISYRKTCLNDILKILDAANNIENREDQTLILLWNLGLFFEFHEWVEQKWKTATGDNKKALQALILSAIVYEQITYQRMKPARKTASKAVQLLEKHSHYIPLVFTTDDFILALKNCDPAPPMLEPDIFDTGISYLSKKKGVL